MKVMHALDPSNTFALIIICMACSSVFPCPRLVSMIFTASAGSQGPSSRAPAEDGSTLRAIASTAIRSGHASGRDLVLLHGASLWRGSESCLTKFWFDFTGLGPGSSDLNQSLQFTEMSQIREQSCPNVACLFCMDMLLDHVSSADRAALSWEKA